jgi:hypothetical protein
MHGPLQICLGRQSPLLRRAMIIHLHSFASGGLPTFPTPFQLRSDTSLRQALHRQGRLCMSIRHLAPQVIGKLAHTWATTAFWKGKFFPDINCAAQGRSQAQLWSTAVHESGHMVVAWLLHPNIQPTMVGDKHAHVESHFSSGATSSTQRVLSLAHASTLQTKTLAPARSSVTGIAAA